MKLRRAGDSTGAATESPQLQPVPLLQRPLPEAAASSVAADVAAVGRPVTVASKSAAARQPASDASPQAAGSAPGGPIPPADAAAESPSAQQLAQAAEQTRRSRSIAVAAAAIRAAQAAAADAGPAAAVLQQLLPWRLAALDATAVAGATTGTAGQHPAGNLPADEAARLTAQRQATALAAIGSMADALADEKRSCLAALEAQQVRCCCLAAASKCVSRSTI